MLFEHSLVWSLEEIPRGYMVAMVRWPGNEPNRMELIFWSQQRPWAKMIVGPRESLALRSLTSGVSHPGLSSWWLSGFSVWWSIYVRRPVCPYVFFRGSERKRLEIDKSVVLLRQISQQRGQRFSAHTSPTRSSQALSEPWHYWGCTLPALLSAQIHEFSEARLKAVFPCDGLLVPEPSPACPSP